MLLILKDHGQEKQDMRKKSSSYSGIFTVGFSMGKSEQCGFLAHLSEAQGELF